MMTPKTFSLSFLTIAVLVAAGCGQTAQNPKEEVRAVAIRFTENIKNSDYAAACKLSSDQDRCKKVLGFVALFTGSPKAQAAMNKQIDKTLQGLKTATIVVQGDRATIKAGQGVKESAAIRRGDSSAS